MKRHREELSLLLMALAACSSGETLPPSIPTAPVASATVSNTPANPWPTIPSQPTVLRAVPTPSPTEPAIPEPPQVAVDATAVVPGTLPPPPPDDRIMRLMRGTWVLRYPLQPNTSVHECRLVMDDAGRGVETCSRRFRAPPGERSCAPGGGEMTRVTESPYTLTVHQGVLLFTPGVGRAVRDTTCTPRTNASHTTMRAVWGTPSVLVVRTVDSNGNNSTETDAYQREEAPSRRPRNRDSGFY